jgi:hypothetical protein
MQLNC